MSGREKIRAPSFDIGVFNCCPTVDTPFKALITTTHLFATLDLRNTKSNF